MLATAFLFALSCASFATVKAADGVRGAMALPQITQGPLYAAMKARQGEQCEKATETPCADGNGCCPSGAACGYTTYQGQQYGICEGYCKVGVATCTTPITACCLDVGETCGVDGTCTAAGATLGTNTYISTTDTEYTPAMTTGSVASTDSGLGSFSTSSDDSSFPTTTSSSSSHTTSRRTTSTSSTSTSSPTTSQATSSTASGGASKNLHNVDTNAMFLLPIVGLAWEIRQWFAVF